MPIEVVDPNYIPCDGINGGIPATATTDRVTTDVGSQVQNVTFDTDANQQTLQPSQWSPTETPTSVSASPGAVADTQSAILEVTSTPVVNEPKVVNNKTDVKETVRELLLTQSQHRHSRKNNKFI